MSHDVIASFVIPVYNTSFALLSRCIESVFNCGCENVEVIIVNDGSKNEETNEACRKLENKDKRLQVFYQENQGVSVARNHGIRKSTGRYVFFVDPDDYMTDELAEIVDELSEETADIVVYDCYRETVDGIKSKIDLSCNDSELDAGTLIKNTLFHKTVYGEYYGGAVWAKAFKKAFLEEQKLEFDPSLRKAQDRAFMLYAYDSAKMIKYAHRASYIYYQNIESICYKYNANARKRSHAFAKAVQAFLDSKENIEDKRKLIAKVHFLSFFEILYLDLFNCDNPNHAAQNMIDARNEYNNFDIQDAVKALSLKDFDGKSEKIKYILIKWKLFILLRYVIRMRQTRTR